MKLQTMFQKDINRDINGVVKVAQNDDNSLKQELSEYIITRELRRHFSTFFDNYSRAIDRPTDKIGVWISGFFGSGKSHFLKMLSYLLSNQEVCGKRVMDYFADKFDDPMMYAQAVKCTSVPTESILFNIDIVGPINKDKTAVLRVFAKMFYNHCGFYGDDLKIAAVKLSGAELNYVVLNVADLVLLVAGGSKVDPAAADKHTCRIVGGGNDLGDYELLLCLSKAVSSYVILS